MFGHFEIHQEMTKKYYAIVVFMIEYDVLMRNPSTRKMYRCRYIIISIHRGFVINNFIIL